MRKTRTITLTEWHSTALGTKLRITVTTPPSYSSRMKLSALLAGEKRVWALYDDNWVELGDYIAHVYEADDE